MAQALATGTAPIERPRGWGDGGAREGRRTALIAIFPRAVAEDRPAEAEAFMVVVGSRGLSEILCGVLRTLT